MRTNVSPRSSEGPSLGRRDTSKRGRHGRTVTPRILTYDIEEGVLCVYVCAHVSG